MALLHKCGLLHEGREFTLVTTRNSGASCFNLVELQNGVVGLAHANLIIPFTLCGSAETESGKISKERLQENMKAALQVYLDRVNEVPFGSSVIKMYRSATDQQAAQMKQERTDLLVQNERYKIGKERAQREEARPIPPLRTNLEPTRATHGEKLTE